MRRSGVATDPCRAGPAVGTVCRGGAIYAGSLNPGSTTGSGVSQYMVTPGNCEDIPGNVGTTTVSVTEFTVNCPGGTDTLRKTWNDGSNNFFDITLLTNFSTTLRTDDKYGSENTDIIITISLTTQGGLHAAARYCDRLIYGGYTDWFLPSRQELDLLYTNRASIPGLNTTAGNFYSSSTETSNTSMQGMQFSDGVLNSIAKTSALYIRCMRRYN